VTRHLLDTQVLVRLLLGRREAFSDRAEQLLTDGRNRVAVSSVCVWEIAIKRSRGRLRIGKAWPLAITALGFDAMPVTRCTRRRSSNCPGITAIRSIAYCSRKLRSKTMRSSAPTRG
jgi:PIN domain nuclease of toxin-antitoxin system